jgi:two-component system sensor histidine kinase BaeS
MGCGLFVGALAAIAIGAIGVWAVLTTIGLIAASGFVRIVAVGGVLLGVLLLLGVWRGIRSFAAPLDDLVDAAGRVEEGDFSARVTVRGPGDVRQLARAFNDMSGRLEENERQRRAYLADVTHELRTPLSVIQGQLEAIIDGVYPADAEHLHPILEQAHTLNGLIEDLRTLTAVESGTLTLRPERIDLAVLLNDAVGALRPGAEARGVELALPALGPLPPIDADPVRIRSVVTNLLANAIRHTPSGGSVTVTAAPDPAGVRVAVRDTGPGIPADLLPRVFERFVKSEDSEGSGLGLAIARDLVAAHGGTIEAHNDPAGGAAVSFTLPAAS